MQKIHIIVANTDNTVMEYFECMVLETFYSCSLCLRNEKVINFQIFPSLVQEKCWPQQKLWYLAKNVVFVWCKTVSSIFGVSNGPPNLFNLQKALIGLKVTKFLFKISQCKFLVMREKNIFVYTPFFVIKYFRFQFIFHVKTATSLKKVAPFFPSNHPLRSWDLRTDILSSLSFYET